ncbi:MULTISPECIES: cysteine--tRNA ligase [Leptolyngbya]|jgi:cysteinyl-tRNA synthetase|uniref:Cysteine--tRNA ligase n=2 Tax=Leptolyngbya boryana TaxID=1184 RepID=A0A1Z4JKD8_LEPBY|nr:MULTISPECIES: cysteine--tRNA ligase [Leptolyngbya]BAY57190.1 CysS protein [Leptolyngbya boryana NIES-2135]MBD2367060.1 cysteine--tRNA ligase [Leptolyngbya sp. FACHB-161]MBD2373587.1 cysteine--tRNA ligase [Leptolyngbya sp. FACHB-238]MBD2397995.1 cysteine--tRNA ligase [Leptolyngbya sp. FACHB-239]MBD2404497.1 cysteine--tRNA ligase [Leptolyngbya sp. FACHB-402]
MALVVYNTLTRRKEPFEPIESGHVKMYCCGVTVYDFCHLGHARSYIAWDTVRRYLTWRGYKVRYVQNFTDIDDKILNRAREEGSTMEAVAERNIQLYFEDMRRLNILDADAYPRATNTIDGIKRLIYELEQKEFAYAAGGDVYYAVQHDREYGKLSGRKLEDMQAGASGRVDDEEPKKRYPFDFALWKGAKPGEPAWDSPWGKGRPGWHIECSAMVREFLGETIDIHVGGADLVFPHHENEIAQSEAATGKSLANYWLHNGMVNVDGEKMSKSLGNFTTIRDLLDKKGIDPMVIRFFVLQASYRKPIDFTNEALSAAQNGWETLKDGLLFGFKLNSALEGEIDRTSQTVQEFQAAMDDDFNTSGALAALFPVAKELQRQGNILVHEGKTDTAPDILQVQWKTLVELAKVLGLEAEPEAESSGGLSDSEIETLIQQRKDAKKAKDFAEADRIRNDLQVQGITLIDKPGGEVIWHR